MLSSATPRPRSCSWCTGFRPAAAVRAAKSVLDPAGILNPGVLIDPGAS